MVRLWSSHILAQDFIGKRFANKGWIGKTIGQFNILNAVVVLVFDDVVQFNIQGIFGIVRIVGTVAFVFDADAIEHLTINFDGFSQQKALIICGIFQGVHFSIPVILEKSNFNILQLARSIEILRGKRMTGHGQEASKNEKFHHHVEFT